MYVNNLQSALLSALILLTARSLRHLPLPATETPSPKRGAGGEHKQKKANPFF